jgi:hypothetical protein
MSNEKEKLETFLNDMMTLLDHDINLKTFCRIAQNGKDGSERDELLIRGACSVITAMIKIRRLEKLMLEKT